MAKPKFSSLKPLTKTPAQTAQAKKDAAIRDAKGVIPCLLLVIGVIVALGFMFSAMLKSAKP